jgi:ADP-ribose pyrophosphatase
MSKIKKWDLLSEEDVSPSPWFPLFRHKVKLANGHILDDYYISKLGDVAMIVPVTDKNGFIFVRQYKHGIREITLEFPAGIIEKGQSPEVAALAELEQETGAVSDAVVLLGKLKTLPSKNFSTLYGFVAKKVKITKMQQLDISEEIETVELSENEVEEKIMLGEINCSDTIDLYLLYKLRSASETI